MQENGYITVEQTALAQSRSLGVKRPLVRIAQMRLISPRRSDVSLRKHMVRKALYEGGLSVRTTLDPQLQIKAERALREGLEALDRRQGWRGPLARLDPGKAC